LHSTEYGVKWSESFLKFDSVVSVNSVRSQGNRRYRKFIINYMFTEIKEFLSYWDFLKEILS